MHLFLLVVGLHGCAPVDGSLPTGEATGEGPSPAWEEAGLTASGAYLDVYVLDDDAGALVRYLPSSGAMTTTSLGTTPGRLARTESNVWVTLPAARSVAVFEERAGRVTRTATLETGAEPLGIAVNEDGSRLYVALSTADEVVELDADGTTLRSWSVPGLPSWLALRPDGDALYVGSATGGTLTWIDLDSGASAAVELPPTYTSREDLAFPLTNRITGDLAVSADGDLLAVPMLMTDNQTPLDPPSTNPDEVDNGYATVSSADINRFNPTIALVPLGDDGAPDGLSAALVLVSSKDAMNNLTRSYLASVAITPDGTMALGTMEAARRLVAISTDVTRVDSVGGFARTRSMSHVTAAGPRRLAFGPDDTVYVDCFLDREIVPHSLEDLRDLLGNGVALHAPAGVALDASPLDADVIAGRRLFYAADDDAMVGSGAGVSCSTCHLGGRNDGLSWNLEDGYRQTPSLAGGVAATAPVTWASDVESVSDEVRITSEGRMGGAGLTDTQVAQVAAFIESIRAPDVPGLGSADAAVARGSAIFWRDDVSCATCHSGTLYTDNAYWSLFGMRAVNTPSLRRVSATAPYLHDGRAATLREVLELSRDGSMGDTSMLTDAEMDDLEAFLRSI